MENRHCPYLGIIDDPSTNKDFPYEGNACHRAQKPVKIILEYQETTCLSEAYCECPGYTRGWENGFPLELRADYDPTTKNIFKRFQFWREEQQRKRSQRKQERERRGEGDWKEQLLSKFQLKKDQTVAGDKRQGSRKDDFTEVTKPVAAVEQMEETQEKKIIQDETALKEYLRSKRKMKNPLKSILSKDKEEKHKADEKKLKETMPALTKQKQKKSLKETLQNILPWKKEPQQKVEDKQAFQDEKILKKEQKPKRDWKAALIGIIPWRKAQNRKKAVEPDLQTDQVVKKQKKQRKSLKEVLQNILPWKKEKQLKQDRKKAIKERLSLGKEKPAIESTPDLVQSEATIKEEVHPIEEEPEALPNVWVKEEEQLTEEVKAIPQEEIPQWEKDILENRGTTLHAEQVEEDEEELPDVMAWRDRKKRKEPKKEGLFSKLFGKKKEKPVKQRKEKTSKGVMALRDKRRKKTGWKKVFKDRRVWWVSLVIIMIFLLVIFIPQLPSVNLNIRERLDGLFNPPIAGTTETTADTPTSVVEGITQTEAILPTATGAAVNTPGEGTTPADTPTATIAPTGVPTSTPTPGVPPFIYLTPETPEP